MGAGYEISCKKCGATAGVSEGNGMRFAQTFENLFLNYMDEAERVSFARQISDESVKDIDKCTFSKEALRCEKCLAITSRLVWSIAFRNGWSFSPPLRCKSCRCDLKRFPFPGEGDFKSQCWECDSDTLSVELSYMWD
jgi:hypothetical protein